MFAQSTPETTPTKPSVQKEAPQAQQNEGKMACSMPDIREVQSLNVTEEQLAKVQEIHAECERACAESVKASGTMDKDVMAKHQERVKEVLTAEQYERYKALSARHEKKSTEMKSAQ